MIHNLDNFYYGFLSCVENITGKLFDNVFISKSFKTQPQFSQSSQFSPFLNLLMKTLQTFSHQIFSLLRLTSSFRAAISLKTTRRRWNCCVWALNWTQLFSLISCRLVCEHSQFLSLLYNNNFLRFTFISQVPANSSARVFTSLFSSFAQLWTQKFSSFLSYFHYSKSLRLLLFSV